VRSFLSRARAALAMLGLSALASAPVSAQKPSAPANELDAFMEKVLARREVNRKVLQQYILDDDERFEILGPGRWPLYRLKREFTWYVRDGMHVRSPVRFDGVAVGEEDRRKYEDEWIERERGRLERKKEKDAKAGQPAPDPSASTAIDQMAGSNVPLAPPRFVSEAYFMDFKFEPGNYYLAGREQLEGKTVLRIEYYPQRLFTDDDDEHKNDAASDEARKKESKAQDPKKKRDREKDEEARIERQMNKTALVTLWVDPDEHQIVKYTFDNVWMDFLPGGWLVRVDDLRASMTMGQPIAGVWLPREINIHGGVSLANGSYEASYSRAFSKYRLADVTSKIRIPKQAGVLPIDRDLPSPISDLPSRSAGGPFVDDDEVQAELIGEIRVHGNASMRDDEVIQLAGIAIGQPLTGDADLQEIERRLKQSNRFESVEVRKRYRSLTSTTDVAIVLLVHERPGITSLQSSTAAVVSPLHRVRSRLMFLPILGYDDGYGFTYGARFSTIGLLGIGERLSVPLTWGGTRRAAVEFERPFKSGPLTRVLSSFGIWNRENPRFDVREQRVEAKARAERQFGRFVRVGADTSRSTVEFGAIDDRQWTLGTDVAFDTRGDPAFPRNAVLASTGWNGLHVIGSEPRIDRYTSDLRGYVGVYRQAVVAARVRYSIADATLPPYERLLVGGSPTLRGFSTGTFDGDRSLLASAELRVPITSVLSGAKLGVSAFMDAAKIYDVGTRLSDAPWRRGAGGGIFLIASIVRINLDVAYGIGTGDTHVHLSSGFTF
jgi:surface antigen Omp85-like protein/POTRA domain-containing FtsQ-type protein